jgi:hypothetical protein
MSQKEVSMLPAPIDRLARVHYVPCIGAHVEAFCPVLELHVEEIVGKSAEAKDAGWVTGATSALAEASSGSAA